MTDQTFTQKDMEELKQQLEQQLKQQLEQQAEQLKQQAEQDKKAALEQFKQQAEQDKKAALEQQAEQDKKAREEQKKKYEAQLQEIKMKPNAIAFRPSDASSRKVANYKTQVPISSSYHLVRFLDVFMSREMGKIPPSGDIALEFIDQSEAIAKEFFKYLELGKRALVINDNAEISISACLAYTISKFCKDDIVTYHQISINYRKKIEHAYSSRNNNAGSATPDVVLFVKESPKEKKTDARDNGNDDNNNDNDNDDTDPLLPFTIFELGKGEGEKLSQAFAYGMAISDTVLEARNMCYPWISIAFDVTNFTFSCRGYIPFIQKNCKFWRYGEIQMLKTVSFDEKSFTNLMISLFCFKQVLHKVKPMMTKNNLTIHDNLVLKNYPPQSEQEMMIHGIIPKTDTSNKKNTSRRKSRKEYIRGYKHGIDYIPECKMWCNNTVMAYPKIEGTHFPSTFGQVIQVLLQLCILWKNNLCHGDVRLANMIFGENSSRLIDFDYCGVEGERKYPNGYNIELDDTKRHPEATPGSLLQRSHDWYSFQFILQSLSCRNQTDEDQFNRTKTVLFSFTNWEDVCTFMDDSDFNAQNNILVQCGINTEIRNKHTNSPPQKLETQRKPKSDVKEIPLKLGGKRQRSETSTEDLEDQETNHKIQRLH